MALPWGEIATGSMAGFAIGWRIYDGIKEKSLTKQYKLVRNPERCQQHGEAIARLETKMSVIEEDIKEIKGKID
jgi:hypothetical protein